MAPPSSKKPRSSGSMCLIRVEKALRLYEQEPPHHKMRRLGEYVRHCGGWVTGGLAASNRWDHPKGLNL